MDDLLDLEIGAYGNDDPTRANLVGIVRQRATTHCGLATGKTAPDELRQAGAHTVLPDLTDIAALVNTVTN